MHSALRLTEISQVMCELLDRRTLARLARTCHVLEEPALDALWKVFPGLGPIAALFPGCSWISVVDLDDWEM